MANAKESLGRSPSAARKTIVGRRGNRRSVSVKVTDAGLKACHSGLLEIPHACRHPSLRFRQRKRAACLECGSGSAARTSACFVCGTRRCPSGVRPFRFLLFRVKTSELKRFSTPGGKVSMRVTRPWKFGCFVSRCSPMTATSEATSVDNAR